MGRKKSSIGCLFWVALILLVLVIFLFNRNTIETVLERTGLMDQIARDRTPDDAPEVAVEIIEEPPSESPEPVDEPELSTTPDEEQTTVVVDPTGLVDAKSEDEVESAQPETPTRVRKAKLYFVRIDGESAITLREVVRTIGFDDSPLTVTLEALIHGLSSGEIGRGLLSLLPEGTALRGVVVRDETAYIDFNESFRFNAFGQEGYHFQLQQVVFTATEFQTVKDVQFLIEGSTLSYLGPESPYVGEPLSRASFAS